MAGSGFGQKKDKPPTNKPFSIKLFNENTQ